MRSRNKVIVPTLIMTLIVIISISLNPQVHAQNNKTFTRLEAQDVLRIIAYPLPEGSKKGFYLPNADISNVNLAGVDFRAAMLALSDLSGSLLPNANLSGADLQEAKLVNANLSNANLSNAWLLASDLEGATIVYAKLDSANLEDANLIKVSFEGSSLVNVNLKGADITDTSFTSAIMSGVTLPNGEQYKEGYDLVSPFGAKSNP